jgi:hypothetical protein
VCGTQEGLSFDELALTIADLEDFIFGQKLGDNSFTYRAGWRRR